MLATITDSTLLSDRQQLGCTIPGEGVDRGTALLVEWLATLVFVFVVYSGLTDRRHQLLPHNLHHSSTQNRRRCQTDQTVTYDNDDGQRSTTTSRRQTTPSATITESLVSGTTLIGATLVAVCLRSPTYRAIHETRCQPIDWPGRNAATLKFDAKPSKAAFWVVFFENR